MMQRNYLLIAILGAFMVLCWFCLRFHGPIIEKDVKSRTQAAIYAYNYEHVRVESSGRDLHLTGMVAKEQDKSSVINLAKKVRGVRKLTHDLAISQAKIGSNLASQANLNEAEQIRTPQLLLTRKDTLFQIEGFLENEQASKGFQQWFQDSFSNHSLQQKLVFQKGLPTDWLPAAKSLTTALMMSTDGEALLEEGQWQLFANVGNAAIRTQLHSVLNQQMPSRYRSKTQISLKLSEALGKCQNQLDTLLSGKRIQFEVGSAALQPESLPLLNQVYQIAKDCESIHLQVTGHTDTSGDPQKNQELSQSRAESVRQFLVSKGLSSNQISAVGQGSRFPIANNQSSQGRIKNRRIEFIILEQTP